MTTDHRANGARKLAKFLAESACGTCAGIAGLSVRYKSSPWKKPSLTTWGGSNVSGTIKRVEVLCAKCCDDEVDRYRKVWFSGLKFDTCQIDECLLKPVGRGFCTNHRFMVLRLTGFDTRPMRDRGTGSVNGDGYLKRYDKERGRAILDHRSVMETHLGRELLPNENVHHKNGNRLDNRLDNLELWVVSQPFGQRASDLYDWAKQIIDLYEKDIEDGKIK